MTLGELTITAKGFYGLEAGAANDALFTDSVMMAMANNGHQSFAAVARPYYKPFNVALPIGTTGSAVGTGTSVVTLDPTVLELDIYTVRVAPTVVTAWFGLPFKPRKELAKGCTNGALENQALGTAPSAFFQRPGAADASGRVIEVFPGLTAAVPLGCKYDAWVYPPDLTTAADVPEMQPAEHYRLLPWICWQMALLERSRSRPDAPVGEWYAVALDVAEELHNILWRAHQGAPRTAEVGSSSGEDALYRRTAMLRRRQ